MKHTRILALALLCGFFATASGAAPAQYYARAENKNQRALLEALSSIIASHTSLSYKSLNDYYPRTDAYDDGTLWDIYSTKHWSKSNTCGQYSSVGDCYNKEHSFPKSWFDDASPMNSDIMHIYPTDGKVNGQRSNYPYGECAGGTTLAGNGGVKALGRLGSSTFAGYTGKVFEPDDEYKGDLARTYFYMAACYYSRTASWSSDMLAGNNFPFFKPWAVNLLLKWNRQDPVSSRETKRNDEIYDIQHNRNPFIDHPELAEYIWGDRTSQYWSATGSSQPQITLPVGGSSVDMGVSAIGVKLERTVQVLTVAATSAVTVTATAPFTVSPATVTAQAANAGTTVKVTYLPAAVGQHKGTLTVAAGDAKTTVNLSGQCVAGLPVMPATEITDESFTANWTYVGDADSRGCYTITVSDADGVLDGYPRNIDAAAGHCTVDGLQPLTQYSYILRSNTLASATQTVTTGEPVPSVDYLFDGELFFSTVAGEPSAVAEIFVDIDHIEGSVSIGVRAPFEISTDRSNWTEALVITADEDRIYMRLHSDTPGNYQTSVVTRADGYYSDDTVVYGEVLSAATFTEDFEATGKYDTYNAQTYQGNACVWSLVDAGIWASDKTAHSGTQALRCGKSSKALIEMTADRRRGIGTVSFHAVKWTASEASATLAVETSADGGASWQQAGTVTIENADNFKEYHIAANIAGAARMRLRQTEGKRFFIDDISLSDHTSGVADPRADRHMWDAYALDGNICVDVTAPDGIDVAIYTAGGLTVYAGPLADGHHTFAGVAPGTVAIVYSGGFSRTLLVK